jgi:hypothetical protein
VDILGLNEKPLDFGSSSFSASVSFKGELLSFLWSQGHVFGFYPVPPLNEQELHSPDSVRRYRLNLSRSLQGLGLRFNSKLPTWDGSKNRFVIDSNDKASSFEVDSSSSGLIYTVSAPQDVKLTLSGNLYLYRACYGQITERNPVVSKLYNLTGKQNSDTSFSLFSEELQSGVLITVKGASFSDFNYTEKNGLDLSIARDCDCSDFKIQFSPFKNEVSEALAWNGKNRFAFPDFKELEHIVQGNFDYIRGACNFRQSEEESCLVTDHMLLPLGWNRDNFYMAAFLMEAYRYLKDESILKIVENHLNWLYSCWDKDFGWGRSHYVSGEMKDPVYQVDQQCYPLLEAAWYKEITGHSHQILSIADEVFAQIRARAESGTWLIVTEENPADDPVLYPYHFSTQILLWYTAVNLFKASCGDRFLNIAEKVQRDTLEYFTVSDDELGDIFAYTTDGKKYELYHDANDVLVALAPLLGFVCKTNPVWLNTIKFAFSSKNSGWYAGKYGGLGSIHAPGKWPLGDVQEYMIHTILENAGDKQRVLMQIMDLAFQDGLFAESVCAQTGVMKTRHWFSWPGALFCLFILRHFRLQGQY